MENRVQETRQITMAKKTWENIRKYQVTDKGKAALLKVLEAHYPDCVVVLPSDYDWSHIQLYYSIVNVTVEFDFVKIAVSSQSSEKKFSFDDIESCLRYLDKELTTNRTSAFG